MVQTVEIVKKPGRILGLVKLQDWNGAGFLGCCHRRASPRGSSQGTASLSSFLVLAIESLTKDGTGRTNFGALMPYEATLISQNLSVQPKK